MSNELTSGHKALEALAPADHFNYWMYRRIAPHINGRILEIGSGIGNIAQFIVRDFTQVTLSDYDDIYLEHLRKTFSSSARLNGIFKIDLQHADFEQMYKQLRGTYDTIVMLNVIEHLADDHRAVRNCRYLLRPSGRLIVLAPAYEWLYSRMDKELGHYRRYTVKRLSTIVQQCPLAITHKFYFNFMGIPAWLYGKIRRFPVLGKKEMRWYNRLVPLFRIADKLTFGLAGLSAVVVAQKIPE